MIAPPDEAAGSIYARPVVAVFYFVDVLSRGPLGRPARQGYNLLNPPGQNWRPRQDRAAMKGLFGFSFFDLALAVTLVGFVLWMVSVRPSGIVY